jgi:hypothetical protein
LMSVNCNSMNLTLSFFTLSSMEFLAVFRATFVIKQW